MLKDKLNAKSVQDLINAIYEENANHLDFMEDMGGSDCACDIHTTLNTIFKFMNWEVGE